MATTNWAGLVNAAYQKLVNANATAVQQHDAQVDANKRLVDSQADTYKNNVRSSNINATDRGMGYSGANVQRGQDIKKSYDTQVDLTKRNNLGTLARIAQQKVAAKTAYDQQKAQIDAQQAAETMSRIAQLPPGINFAALRAADPAYAKKK